MQHMGFEQCLGSTVVRTKNKKYSAFSLAEMLVVLLIMSFIAIGMPLIHFKKMEMKTKRSVHGRYECFYNKEGKLSQFTTNEEGAESFEEGITKCQFQPPKNATYFVVHAVGGGGGAAFNLTLSAIKPNPSMLFFEKRYDSNDPNKFPQWMKDVQGAGKLPALLPTETEYRTRVKGSEWTFTYAPSGNEGQTASIFLPRLNNVSLEMNLGKGGDVRQPGEDTVVKMITEEGNEISLLTAKGGKKAKAHIVDPRKASFWAEGEASGCRIKNLNDRKFHKSKFSDIIEMDEGTKMNSKIDDSLAGSGGTGAYAVPYKVPTGIFTWGYPETRYFINDQEVSDFVKKPTCEEPTACDEGATPVSVFGYNIGCMSQPGKNGAVVILW